MQSIEMLHEIAADFEDSLVYSALVLKVDSVGARSRALLGICKYRIFSVKRASKKVCLATCYLLESIQLNTNRLAWLN
jgi:hypothetical protein